MSIELKSNEPSGPIETAWSRHKFDIKVVNPANDTKSRPYYNPFND